MEIEFKTPLPSLYAGNRKIGVYNNDELGFPGVLTAKDARLGLFLHLLRNTVWEDRRLVFVDGRILMCSKNWIRDHVHEMKGFMHWEYDLASFLDFILETQRPDGQFFELIKQMDDRHWAMVEEDCRILYPEDNQSLVRLELEADVEYLVVEGALQYYRVTGDLSWLRAAFPMLEKAIRYITSDSKRWDGEHGLVKRPFSIDTWDFCYGQNNNIDRRIHPDSPMSIFHGDNTGVFAAMRTLAFFARKLGEEDKATFWEAEAQGLKERIFRYLWNGRFFRHQLHLGHSGADDREEERLSLSNAYALNRGILTAAQAQCVVEEYMHRKEQTGAFAEWFTIDPPYEDFCGYKPGQYVNGAISPFTAGELCKGAFACGYETYAWSILERFMEIGERDGKICFLYSPENCAPQDNQGPSAWGAAALLSAVDEGLAGVQDLDCGYRELAFSPRFPATPYTELRYLTGYEKAHVKVDIRYILTEKGMRYDLDSPARTLHAHLLLPTGKTPCVLRLNEMDFPFTLSRVRESLYMDFTVAPPENAPLRMEVLFR